MPIKKLLLSLFQEPETHPTAKDLLDSAQAQGLNIEIDAINEALAELINEEKVYQVDSKDGVHFGKSKGTHFHFICPVCGRVRDFFMEEGALKMIQSHAQSKLRHVGKVENVNLSVEGLCFDCTNKL